MATLNRTVKSRIGLEPGGMGAFITGLPSMYHINRPCPGCPFGWSQARSYLTGCLSISCNCVVWVICLFQSAPLYIPQCKQEWLVRSPFQVSMMSISPSVGHVKGSNGSNQKAGHIPLAHGLVMTAVNTPLSLVSRWRDTRRAEVNLWAGSGWLLVEIALSMSFPSCV